MSSIELNDIPSGYNLNKINDNFGRIEIVINEQLLHRVNSDDTPNSVETDIDMNGQHLYNLPKPVLGSSPLRLKDLFGDPDELLQGPDTEHITATAGQTVFNLSSSYVVGTNSLLVFRDGVYQRSPSQYTESSTTSITFTVGMPVDTVISVVPVAVLVEGSGGVQVTGAANLGTGSGVFSNRTGNSLMFKSLKAGSGVTITDTPTEVQITSSAATLTASNIGTIGEGVFASKVGNDFQFKKLRAGSNVTLTSDSTGVVINSSGGGGVGSPVAIYDNSVLKTSGATSLNFINATVSSSLDDITVQVPAEAYISVKDYGATGDGVTDDSSNIQAAITAAKSANRTLFFPDGVYVISSLGVQSGRISLLGTGNSVLKGSFSHTDTYTISADTLTPLTATSKFLNIENMMFESVSEYGLNIQTIEQPSFLSTFKLTNCKFFGPKGLYCRHMIGFELNNCEFNNKLIGAKFDGCNNGIFSQCRWQNQADTGVWITYAPDHGVNGTDRKGGENLKFSACEWAVCTYGIYAEMHMWLTLDSCLLDYCAVPIYLRGSTWAKMDKCYLGASNSPVTMFSGVTGYRAPPSSGIALLGHPGGYVIGDTPVGVTAVNCEFINYVTGSTQPIVYVDGYISGTYPMSADEVSFIDCLFYAGVNHSSQHLMDISHVAIARVIANRFRSFNKSTSMSNAYRTYVCYDWLNHSNSFWNCTQSSVQLGSDYERPVGAIVSSSDPGALGAGVIWVQP